MSEPKKPKHDAEPIPRVVLKRDLIDLITLSRAVAEQMGMEIAEACDLVSSTIIKQQVPVYNKAWRGLPEAIYLGDDDAQAYNEMVDHVAELYNSSWWEDESQIKQLTSEKERFPSLDDTAIETTLASKLFGTRFELPGSANGDAGPLEFMDDPKWPVELDIAVTAWRAARNRAEHERVRPGAFIRDWLASYYPDLSEEARRRIATVANWDKSPGAPKKK